MLIRSEADRLAYVLSRVDPDAPVPSCPGWTASELLWHLTEVHEFWSTILRTRAVTDEDAERIERQALSRPGTLEEILQRREQATAALVEQLEARDDAEEAWSWLPSDRTVGFTRRMQLHEATMHRVDAQLTTGGLVLAPLARIGDDGIIHAVEVMWEAGHHRVPDGTQLEEIGVLDIEPVHGTRHQVELTRCHGIRDEDGAEYARILARALPPAIDASALPVARARGSAVALYLWIWGREAALEKLDTGPEHVRLGGDAVAVAATENLLAQGME